MRTLKNTKRGFIGVVLFLILAGIGACFYFFGSESVMSALTVFKGKAEAAVVGGAGKSDVAEELALRRIDDLRQKLVRVKSLKRTIKRATENPDISESAKARYNTIVAKLDAAEKKAEEAYKNANSQFDELRAQLAVSDAETAILKASASALDDGKAAKYRHRRDMDKVLQSINEELDAANAELDVSLMETAE